MKKLTFLLIIFQIVYLNSKSGNDDDKTKSIIIENWLKAGNFAVKLPAFSDIENINGDNYSDKELLKFAYTDINDLHPVSGLTFAWDEKQKVKWTEETSDKSGYVHPGKRDSNKEYSIAYYGSYVFIDRWAEVEIKIETPQLCIVYLDGEKIVDKLNFDKDKKDHGNASKKIKLERGNHILIVKTLREKDSKTDWKLKGQIEIAAKYEDASINISISPKQIMTTRHLLEGTKISKASISPDGKYYALKYKLTKGPDGKSTSWTEIRKTKDHSLMHSFRNSKISSLKWSSTNIISYITTDDKESTLWLLDMDKGTETKLLKQLKNFSGYRWAPDGSFIIYSISEKPTMNKTGIKKFEGMPDRWLWWRNRTFLYKVNIESHIKERVTYGNLSTSLQDISNDGRYILFTHNIPDYSERPYSKQALFRLDLQTNIIDTIWTHNWSSRVSFSYDDKSLLVLGGPSVFGSTGENVSKGKTTNNYDTQAYIYNINNKTVDAITIDFNPSIQNACWNKSGEIIYFLCADKSYKKLYRYEIESNSFKVIEGGPDVINHIDFDNDGELAVYTGSSISSPAKAYLINFTDNNITVLSDPEESDYKNVVFGKTEDWNFKNNEGLAIDGHIYYPPDFEPEKKYPLIVYYYGGTSPTKRSFGGRYPKNLFAAQGYIVYVLQPAGATGYGQEFSALHVNNWGITVADEIIKGTKKFLEKHPFIDKTKVGCIGASYGGFMTMLLQTRTDIFAAAIAHAGISSISSYWGEGYWGYLYSAVASANSFPWNNKKLYIEQSPLFLADKINTPLLLLHGSSDTNVPPGESRQLYTALKLLGKDVELIEIAGQDHHILDFKKRILWQKTIFAWFDKYLKGQTAWWDDLYPEENF